VLTDVIAALATPPGRSAVALVRLSGCGAFDVAAAVVRPFAPDAPRTARLARLVHPLNGEALDEALYTVYRAPASYTGEDVVEIATHGGLLVPAEVLGALLVAGAREAAPGLLGVLREAGVDEGTVVDLGCGSGICSLPHYSEVSRHFAVRYVTGAVSLLCVTSPGAVARTAT